MTGSRASSGSFAGLTETEPYPGVFRRRFDSAGATVAIYRFQPNARFPLHRHAEEQVTIVEEGEVAFTVDGEQQTLAPGGWSVVAPHCPHELVAGSKGARILAIIVPKRTGAVGYEVVEDDQGG